METTSSEPTYPIVEATEGEENSSISSTTGETVDEQESAAKPAKSPISKFNDSWAWEILSCLICLVCLACIVAVLLQYDGKPLPEWPYGITINSILSWITQVFTACMIGVVATCLSQSKWIHFKDKTRPLADMNSYDWASRGPAGCSVFLWTSRMRQIAALGALISILSIGTGPFVQQMATVKNRRVLSDSPASIARTESFYEQITNIRPITPEMEYVIYTAIFSGADSTSSNADWASFPSYTKPDCPTGDCIIPRFKSLAACSSCSNATHLLSVRESHVPDNGREEPTAQHVYSLPNGLTLNVTSNAIGFCSDWFIGTSTKSDRDSIYGLEALALPGTKNFGHSAFMNISAILIETDTMEKRVVNATAIQCSLYWCVNTYEATVRNGSVSEPVLDTYHDSTASFSGRYANHEEITILLKPPVSGSEAPATFTIEERSSNGLSRWLAEKLQFSIGSNYCVETYETEVDFTEQGSDFVPFLENHGLPELVSRIAEGITAYIRSANETVFVPYKQEVDTYTLSTDGTQPAHGTAWAVQTQLYVHWAWITLPAVLIILTIVFLITTALQSRNRSLEVWKSSTLPLLCSGLGLEFQQELRVAGGPTQVEDEAKKLQVRCAMNPESPERWRLDVMERDT